MAAPAIIATIQLILMMTIYREDSPAFYSSKGNWEQVEKIYKLIYADEKEATELVTSLRRAEENALRASTVGGGSLFATYKQAFFIGLILPMIQQLTGINIVMFYAAEVFKNQGELAQWLSLAMSIVNFAATLGSVFLADRISLISSNRF